MILGVAHIAVAVGSLEESLKLWRDTLGCALQSVEEVPSEGVRTAFLKAGEDSIELLEALGPESPVAKFIQKRGAGGIHHIALRVDHVETEMKNLLSKGYRAAGPYPRIGAHGTQIAFLHPSSTDGVLIELVQEKT